MFETLLESRRVSASRTGRRASALSLAAHAVVAAWATTIFNLGPDTATSSDDSGERAASYSSAVRFVRLAVATAATPTSSARAPVARPAAAAAATVPAAAAAEADVAAITDSVVDQIERLTDAARELAGGEGAARVEDFRPPAGGSGLAEAIARSINRGRRGNVFYPDAEFPAMALADNPVPEYPEALLAAGVEGEVRVRFVIDTTGALDLRSVRVVASTDERFTRAVRAVLPLLRFRPAESGGTKVPALSEQAFAFVVVVR